MTERLETVAWKAGGCALVIGTALALGLMAGACKRSSSADVAGGALSPIETARLVHQYRVSGQLKRLEPYLLPEQRPHLIELFQSVDQLVSAKQVLKAAVERHLGSATAEVFVKVGMANILGVFSKDVEILDEQITGDKAVVTIQVAGRVPLERVHFVRHEGRWVVQEDPPILGVAQELRNLADVYVAVARMMDERPMTALQLRQELEMRRAPIERRMAELYRQTQASSPSAPATRP